MYQFAQLSLPPFLQQAQGSLYLILSAQQSLDIGQAEPACREGSTPKSPGKPR